MEKRFEYPAVFLGVGLLMLWTHLRMVADIESIWVVGASISTSAFFYLALVRPVTTAQEPTFEFPLDITTARIWLSIAVSAVIMGVALAFGRWPRNIGLEFAFAFTDGLILVAALRKAHDWAWPLGPADIDDVIRDSGNAPRHLLKKESGNE